MEYLSLTGSVHIDEDVAAIHLVSVIGALIQLEFEENGHIICEFDIDTCQLTLEADGLVASETADALNRQLLLLAGMITPASRIVCDRVRWEMNVVLSTTAGLSPSVVDRLVALPYHRSA